jgi:type II secretory pathway component PulK
MIIKRSGSSGPCSSRYRANGPEGGRIDRQGERGSILIVALWSLFFLSVLAVAVNAYVASNLNTAAKIKNRAQLFCLAEASLRLAMAHIANGAASSCDTLKDPWNSSEELFKDIACGEIGSFSIKHIVYDAPGKEEYIYGLIDEERKININKVSLPALKRYFEITAGLTSREASDIAGAIVDWRDSDEDPSEGGAENGYYGSLDTPYRCKNADFQALEELLMVKGVTTGLYNKIKDSLTVYGDGRVNINTAPAAILQSIGIDAPVSEKIARFRMGNDGIEATNDDRIFKTAASIAEDLLSVGVLSSEEIERIRNIAATGALSARSDNFMGKSEARLNNGRDSMKVTFVFDRKGAIKYWREE